MARTTVSASLGTTVGVPHEKLLDLLYQSPGSDQGWRDFLLLASRVLCSDTAEVALFDGANQRFNLNHSVGVPPDAVLAYNARFGAIDEWYLRARGSVTKGYVGPGELLCPARELVKTEFYNDFLRPNNWLHSGAAIIEHTGEVMAVMTLLRGPKRGPFGRGELKKLHALVPHIQRALFLHRRIVDLQACSELEHWGLDQVSFALILIRSDGKVVAANRLATGLCVTNVVSLSSGIARLRDPKEDRLFQSLIRSARQPRLGSEPGGVMKISRPPGASLVASVVPIQHSAVSSTNAVAVFIGDPARRPYSPAKVLSEIYGLTHAEVKLTLLIAEGMGASTAAERLEVSRETVKSQLASIFHKTGVRGQSQLVRLVACLPTSALC